MTSFLQRYLDGEHERVWVELRALGDVPNAVRDDAVAVAVATMRRVAVHVDRIVATLPGLGFTPEGLPVRTPPTRHDHTALAAVEAEIGGLPAALSACLREVGWVWLAGDCDALGLTYHGRAAGPPLPDPLCLPSVADLRREWEEYRDDDWREPPFEYGFAPDELHKANLSGGEHTILLPDRGADAILHGVTGRDGITLVEYLRESVRHGGFPGWAVPGHAGPTPRALDILRADPDF